MFGKLKYIGESMLTRGQYGENISYGHTDEDGYVYIWDSTYGWFLWGKPDPKDWEETGESSNYPGG